MAPALLPVLFCFRKAFSGRAAGPLRTLLRFEVEPQNRGGLTLGGFVLPFLYGIHRGLCQHRASAQDLDVFHLPIRRDHDLKASGTHDVIFASEFRVGGLDAAFDFAPVLRVERKPRSETDDG